MIVSGAKTIDVTKLIDEQPVRSFHVLLVITLFLFMISDGYDVQVMGFAGPGAVKGLHMAKSMLGSILSASLVGLLLGAPIFGWLGDRFGRRSALLWGLGLFGVLTLLTATVQN